MNGWRSWRAGSNRQDSHTQRRNAAKILDTENDLARAVLDAAFSVHRNLGPGLLESVYELALAVELEERQIDFVRHKAVPVIYKGNRLGEGFRADFIVAEKLLLELKSVDRLQSVHAKQVLTYLRLTELRLGLIINFGSQFLKNGISRVVNNMAEAT